MKVTAHIAAQKLCSTLQAPRGAVNTLVEHGVRGTTIRVIIDPAHKNRICSIPKTFMGYKVVVEARPLATASH
jgi:hypothetical protein